MRRLVFGCVALCSCTKENPLWDGESTAATVTDTSGGDTGVLVDPTTGALPTTGAGSLGDSDSTSTGPPELSATDGSTGDPTTTTEPGSTTAMVGPQCAASSWLPLDISDDDLRDAGVVPGSMGAPCQWRAEFPDCSLLNFGTTGFFRLVNDADRGQSAALVRFPRELVLQRVAEAGKAMDDVLTLKIELTVWEQKPQPTGPFTLELRLLHPDDADWDEGDHDAQPGDDDDCRWGCEDFDNGDCDEWEQGDVLAGTSPLGHLEVTPATAMASDLDSYGDQYHARLASEALAPALLEAYKSGQQPSVAVTISSPRVLDNDVVGVKLRESDWAAPALLAEVCDVWQ